MRKKHSKSEIIGILSLMLFGSGCVSIRHENALPFDHAIAARPQISTSSDHGMGVRCQECADPCEVPGPQYPVEISMPWMKPSRPLRYVASGVKTGANKVCSSVSGWKERVCTQYNDWWSQQKQKNNPPPWPKFHPVPAKPVFEGQSGGGAESPEIFGAFGPAKDE